MLWVVHSAWRYRKEILVGIQVVADLRKSARDFTREYIRRRVRESLLVGLTLVLIQLVVLLGALLLVALQPTLLARLAASAALWAITLFNVARFFTSTWPELKGVKRALRGKSGYTLKYLLRISLVTELMHWHVLLPTVCLSVALATRQWLGHRMSYFAPWVEAVQVLNSF